MYYHHCSSVAVILCFILFLAHIHPTDSDLTFAETVYVSLSRACRAIADLRQNSEGQELLNTLKIVHVNGDTVKSFPINKAFAGLTQPSVFDITKETKVIIHGFHDNPYSLLPQSLARAYDNKKIFNILMVDAEEMFKKGYIACVHNSRLIGKRLANLLANLENFGANAEDFHLLGISLGAHAAGWTGKYFQQYKGRRLGHITGLDPAGPCFSSAYSDQRLDKTDANYVDVLHSNRLFQGMIESVGHADFYLNGGGPHQPGCMSPTCSHLRAARVYVESIERPKSFVGVRCHSWDDYLKNKCEIDNYAVLGYGSSKDTRGQYYLRTSAQSPFGLGMDGAKVLQTSVKMDSWLKSLKMR